MQLANKRNALKCFKFLVEQNNPSKVFTESPYSPLYYATVKLNYHAYKIMFDSSETNRSAIIQTCHQKKTKQTVTSSFYAEQQTQRKQRKNKSKLIRHILRYVPVNSWDGADYTSLYFASDLPTARPLIEAGATANVENVYGEPPS